jgi:hypothetical protein
LIFGCRSWWHVKELLRAFKIGPADLYANRTGMLGPRQGDRERRTGYGLAAFFGGLAVAPLAVVVCGLIGG